MLWLKNNSRLRTASATQSVGVAFVGCGYVANMYARTLSGHPSLELVGVTDVDPGRGRRAAGSFNCECYCSLEALLADPRVTIVVNLTNPSAHYEVSRECLVAGKHLYTEKPVALRLDDAIELVDVAERSGLHLSSAPCTVLSPVAQTLWKALRESQIGNVRLVYAEMDDGMVHRMPYKMWVNEAGSAWPYVDEFATGCTIEHAGYVLTWLAAFFGPIESVSAFSECLIPEKLDASTGRKAAADFSVACLRFHSGIVARLTCGIVGPHDHRLRVIGDDGLITVTDPRCDDSPVHIQRYITLRRKMFVSPWRHRCRLKHRETTRVRYRGSQRRDFCRGIVDMAESIKNGHACRLNGRFALHITEATLAIQNAGRSSAPYHMTTSFEPIDPMPWAR